MRAFIALDLPETLCEGLCRLQSSLPFGRLVPAENLHLTLAFLGDQPEDLIEQVHFVLEALKMPKLALQLDGLDLFGGKSPTVLFAGLAKNTALAQLHDRIKTAAHSAGVSLPRERFRPHVTLARFGHRLPRQGSAKLLEFLAAHANFRSVPFNVDGFSLYRSTLGRGAAIHQELARYQLGSGPINLPDSLTR